MIMKKAKKAAKKTKRVAKKEKGDGARARAGQGARSGAAGGGGSGDWRVEMLERIRGLIRQADPEAVEEQKWRKPSNGMLGVPVWSHGGMICTGETYKGAVKVTFARGAALEDPAGLFNASLEGGTRRAIDFREGDEIDEGAFRALVREAVELNAAGK